jgi:hypothetical protein
MDRSERIAQNDPGISYIAQWTDDLMTDSWSNTWSLITNTETRCSNHWKNSATHFQCLEKAKSASRTGVFFELYLPIGF